MGLTPKAYDNFTIYMGRFKIKINKQNDVKKNIKMKQMFKK